MGKHGTKSIVLGLGSGRGIMHESEDGRDTLTHGGRVYGTGAGLLKSRLPGAKIFDGSEDLRFLFCILLKGINAGLISIMDTAELLLLGGDKAGVIGADGPGLQKLRGKGEVAGGHTVFKGRDQGGLSLAEGKAMRHRAKTMGVLVTLIKAGGGNKSGAAGGAAHEALEAVFRGLIMAGIGKSSGAAVKAFLHGIEGGLIHKGLKAAVNKNGMVGLLVVDVSNLAVGAPADLADIDGVTENVPDPTVRGSTTASSKNACPIVLLMPSS